MILWYRLWILKKQKFRIGYRMVGIAVAFWPPLFRRLVLLFIRFQGNRYADR